MAFDEFSLGIIGTLAGILILSGWVPQIIKGYRTKKLDDVSAYLMGLIATGAAMWIVYGVEKNDPYIIGVNVAAIILTMITLSLKLKYKQKIDKPIQ